MELLKMSSLGQFFADSLEKNMVMKDIEYQLVWWKTYWEWSENQKIDFKGFETIFLVCYQSSWWSLVGWASIETSLMTVTNVDPKATGYFKIQFKRSRKIFTPTTKSSQDEFWPFGIIERHFGLQQWAWLRSKMRHLMLRNKVPMAADQWWDWWDGFDERMKKKSKWYERLLNHIFVERLWGFDKYLHKQQQRHKHSLNEICAIVLLRVLSRVGFIFCPSSKELLFTKKVVLATTRNYSSEKATFEMSPTFYFFIKSHRKSRNVFCCGVGGGGGGRELRGGGGNGRAFPDSQISSIFF